MTNEKNSTPKLSDPERINNLVALGLSPEQITHFLNKGMTLNELEDYCNNEMNKVLEVVLKKNLLILANKLQKNHFFPITDRDIKDNIRIKNEIHKEVSDVFLENDVLFKDIQEVNQMMTDKIHSIMVNCQDNFNKTKNELFAKLLGKEMHGDITLKDIDTKYKEIGTKTEEKK